jgi:hypothetical protein
VRMCDYRIYTRVCACVDRAAHARRRISFVDFVFSIKGNRVYMYIYICIVVVHCVCGFPRVCGCSRVSRLPCLWLLWLWLSLWLRLPSWLLSCDYLCGCCDFCVAAMISLWLRLTAGSG